MDVNDLKTLQKDLSTLFERTESLPQFQVDPRDVRVIERLSYSPIQYMCMMDGWNCVMEVEKFSKQQQIEAFVEKRRIREKLSKLVDLPKHPNLQKTFFFAITETEICVFGGCYVSTLKQLLNRARTRKNSIASLLDFQESPVSDALLPVPTIVSICLDLLRALVFLRSHSVPLPFLSVSFFPSFFLSFSLSKDLF